MKTGPGTSRARRASRLSRTAPDVMHGHHSSLLAALREEDTDDEFDDDDAFAFAPKGEGTPSTPGGAHRVFAAGKESMDSPTSPLVTHTKPHTKTYGFAPHRRRRRRRRRRPISASSSRTARRRRSRCSATTW